MGVRRALAGVYGRVLQVQRRDARGVHHAQGRRGRSRAVRVEARALSRTGAGSLPSSLNTPAHVVGEDFTLLDPDGNPVIKVPVAYADVHIQELLVSLAKTALTGGHHFFLTLHFPRAYIPSGWAVIAPTRSTWGTEKPDVNIVAAMSSRKKLEPTGGAVVIRVDDVELGDIGFAMGFVGARRQADLVGQARRRPRQGRPQVLLRRATRHRRRAVLLLPPRRHQVARRRAAARRLSLPARGAHRRRVRRARRRAPGSALRRQPARTLGADVRADGRARRRLLRASRRASCTSTSITAAARWRSCRRRCRRGCRAIRARASTSTARSRIRSSTATSTTSTPTSRASSSPTATPSCTSTTASSRCIPPAARSRAAQASADVDLELARRPPAGAPSSRLKGVDPGEIPKLPRGRRRRARRPPRRQGAPRRQPGASPRAHRADARSSAELARNKPGGRLPRTLKLAGNGEYTPAAHHAQRRHRVGRRRHRRRRRHHRPALGARRRRRCASTPPAPRRCSRAGARPPACASTRCTPPAASRARFTPDAVAARRRHQRLLRAPHARQARGRPVAARRHARALRSARQRPRRDASPARPSSASSTAGSIIPKRRRRCARN